VANAIYYAVDNGAKVINMSFGKYYSPDRAIVEKAIRYAQKKEVLIVHAAGNDHENKDIVDNYPTRRYIKGKKEAWNVIEVGANTRYLNENLTAKFTNYGETSVDLFAPGVYVYSTLPNNSYKESSGTSMSAPVVSGVAALLFSYFPELSANEVREVILESTHKYQGEVYLPGTKELVEFPNLSVSGGTSPYLYSWSNGASTEDINNLGAGTYKFIIIESTRVINVTRASLCLCVNKVKNESFRILDLHHKKRESIYSKAWHEQLPQMNMV